VCVCWCVCSLLFFFITTTTTCGVVVASRSVLCGVFYYIVFFIIWRSTYVILGAIHDSRWRRVTMISYHSWVKICVWSVHTQTQTQRVRERARRDFNFFFKHIRSVCPLLRIINVTQQQRERRGLSVVAADEERREREARGDWGRRGTTKRPPPRTHGRGDEEEARATEGSEHKQQQ